MAKFKALKSGFTNIKSTDISDFSINSDYKLQKIASVDSVTLTLPANSYGLNGDSVSASIPHNLGYIPIFFAFVEYGSKGYEAVGNANPQISLQSMQFIGANPTSDTIYTQAGGSYIDSHVTVGDEIRFTKNSLNVALPAPLQENVSYYVNGIVNSTRFTISTTQGGGTLDITTFGGPYVDIMTNITHPYFGDSGVGFNIVADTTNLNITAFATGVVYSTAKDETFTVRAFFILDQII